MTLNIIMYKFGVIYKILYFNVKIIISNVILHGITFQTVDN